MKTLTSSQIALLPVVFASHPKLFDLLTGAIELARMGAIAEPTLPQESLSVPKTTKPKAKRKQLSAEDIVAEESTAEVLIRAALVDRGSLAKAAIIKNVPKNSRELVKRRWPNAIKELIKDRKIESNGKAKRGCKYQASEHAKSGTFLKAA